MGPDGFARMRPVGPHGFPIRKGDCVEGRSKIGERSPSRSDCAAFRYLPSCGLYRDCYLDHDGLDHLREAAYGNRDNRCDS